jgi:hypothetical protein
MSRAEVRRVFEMADGRRVTIIAYEQIGPEDCMSMLVRAVLHRYLTGEDAVPTISREVKDGMIKQNLVV